MSAKILGKKFLPSGHGSIVAAVDQAYGIPTSAGLGCERAANSTVARSAPAAVIPSVPGGQLGFWTIASTCRERRKKSAAKRIPTTARTGRHQRLTQRPMAVELTAPSGARASSSKN